MHQLQSLSPLHMEAAFLFAQGYKRDHIAAHFDVTLQSLVHWWHSPIFRQQVETYQRQIVAQTTIYKAGMLTRIAVKSLDGLEKLIDGAESEAVRLGAIREGLEITSIKPQRGINLQQNNTKTIILGDKMLTAMHQVSDMLGDTEMLDMIHQVIDIEPHQTEAPGIEPTP